MDETSGKVVLPPRTGLRDIGSGQPIAIRVAKDKLATTMVGAITANGRQLPVAILAKGKTERSLKKFKLKRNIVGILTPKGWMNGNAFIEWMMRVLLAYTQGAPCALLCDDLSVHKTPAVRALRSDILFNWC